MNLNVHFDFDVVTFTLTASTPFGNSLMSFQSSDPKFLRDVKNCIDSALYWSENKPSAT